MEKKTLQAPAIYVLADCYQLVADTKEKGLCTLTVGDRVFTEERSGLLRTDLRYHKFEIEKSLLDKAGHYTLSFTPYPERAAYHPAGGETVTFSSDFTPAPTEGPVRLLLIADVHTQVENALAFVAEAKKRGPVDGVILLGDVATATKTEEDLAPPLTLAAAVAEGKRPVLAARGNHELRGAEAYRLCEVLPDVGGDFFFSFTYGCIDGVVLDCGEDKTDDHPEYGGLTAYAPMRRRETAFLEKLAADPAGNGLLPHPKARLVLSHIPFPVPLLGWDGIFDIERETYGRWTSLCGDLGADLHLAGHLHHTLTARPGTDCAYDQRFPVFVGSVCSPDFLAGTVVELGDEDITVTLLTREGEALGTDRFPLHTH